MGNGSDAETPMRTGGNAVKDQIAVGIIPGYEDYGGVDERHKEDWCRERLEIGRMEGRPNSNLIKLKGSSSGGRRNTIRYRAYMSVSCEGGCLGKIYLTKDKTDDGSDAGEVKVTLETLEVKHDETGGNSEDLEMQEYMKIVKLELKLPELNRLMKCRKTRKRGSW
ncbi:hypothetical protein S83_005269 [Arachis hypogaea]